MTDHGPRVQMLRATQRAGSARPRAAHSWRKISGILSRPGTGSRSGSGSCIASVRAHRACTSRFAAIRAMAPLKSSPTYSTARTATSGAGRSSGRGCSRRGWPQRRRATGLRAALRLPRSSRADADDLPEPPNCHDATSVTPVGSPASIQRASDSGAKIWSPTIAAAPMTPARPPSDDRWTSRSRVASGSDRR